MSFKVLKTLKRVYYKYNFNPDVEIVGNPLIEDAVIKSFSLEDYTDISTSYLKNGYEYVIRFKTGDDIRTIQTVFNTNYNLTIDSNDGFITSYNQETNLRKCKPGKEDANFKPIIEYLDAHPNEDGSKVNVHL